MATLSTFVCAKKLNLLWLHVHSKQEYSVKYSGDVVQQKRHKTHFMSTFITISDAVMSQPKDKKSIYSKH